MKKQVSRGFTLIELLVVVLIIGILAAIAVPQYKLAVAKSRFAAIWPSIVAILNAEESYYLANGKYTGNLADLDLAIKIEKAWGGMVDNSFHVNMLSDRLVMSYCPNGKNATTCVGNARTTVYTFCFAHSDCSNKKGCYGITSFGTKVCKATCGAMGGFC